MTCCFFGHRELYLTVYDKLYNLVRYLIEERGINIFYTGGMGDSDRLFISVVMQLRSKYKNIKLILILPYMTNKINSNPEFYNSQYDDIIIPDILLGLHYKKAIPERNKWMINNSDIVISCVYRNFGGAYKAVKYAEILNKEVISVL